nr:hypothetical protein [Tanacetum cinerariifolium]
MEACHLNLWFWGLGVYSEGDVLNYACLASRLQSVGLQTKLFRHTGIVASGPIFDDALYICYSSGISTGKDVDTGLDGGVTSHYV